MVRIDASSWLVMDAAPARPSKKRSSTSPGMSARPGRAVTSTSCSRRSSSSPRSSPTGWRPGGPGRGPRGPARARGPAGPGEAFIVACGTSYHAGLWGMYLLEHWAGVPTRVEIASEFRYRDPLLRPGDVVLAISQSGETADTLAGMRLARERAGPRSSGCATWSGRAWPGRPTWSSPPRPDRKSRWPPPRPCAASSRC